MVAEQIHANPFHISQLSKSYCKGVGGGGQKMGSIRGVLSKNEVNSWSVGRRSKVGVDSLSVGGRELGFSSS